MRYLESWSVQCTCSYTRWRFEGVAVLGTADGVCEGTCEGPGGDGADCGREGERGRRRWERQLARRKVSLGACDGLTFTTFVMFDMFNSLVCRHNSKPIFEPLVRNSNSTYLLAAAFSF